MIRIAIDTNPLHTGRAGVARHVRGLLAGLESLALSDVSFAPMAWPVNNFGYQQPRRALRTLYREWVWAPWVLPGLLYRTPVDLFHSTSHLRFALPRHMPRVATLYDLAALRTPHRFRPWHRRAWGAFLRRVRTYDRIICISRFTADEAMALLDIPANQVEVIPCGNPILCATPDETTALPEGIPSEYLLFVGSLEPGKNLSLVQSVYTRARQEGKPIPPLVIVGERWRGVPGEGPAPADWHYLGRQPDRVVASLYRRAVALLFPSQYEGFGFPVLEAMTLGCPVICSRIASLPEVGGEAPCYAAATPNAYLEAILLLLNSSSFRLERVQSGIEQARRFSWKTTAAHTVDVYRDVLAKRRSRQRGSESLP